MRKKLQKFVLCLFGLVAFSSVRAALSNLPVNDGNIVYKGSENLNRGLVVVPCNNSNGSWVNYEGLVSWRWLATDDKSTTFDLLMNGSPIATDLRVTNYYCKVNAGRKFVVVTKVNGVEVSRTDPVMSDSWNGKMYKVLTLSRPKGDSYTYSPNDCSAGDVDGDGEYEIIVKWDPSNSQDNSVNGVTGNVYIDCYELDGTQKWRVDLGQNIRAGAHYTQFLVCDFDGDGKAEMICKTAPGSKDGTGVYVNQASTNNVIKGASNTTSWVNTNGRINGGHEYLTVFNGKTGKAIHTIAYNPNRNAESALSTAEGTFNWDDRSGKSDYGSYGNRGERYLAAVASLDGPNSNPSAIFCRGYYTYAYVWAVDFNGTKLIPRWLHRSDSKTSYSVVNYQTNTSGQSTQYTPASPTSGSGSSTLYGNGNHNLSIGDVDGDGKDEIIYGAGALDDNGTLLYATGFGHGDAMHLSDLLPDRLGLEVYTVHEEGNHGWDIHDARTGEIIASDVADLDTGRGIAADIIPESGDGSQRGFEFWSAKDYTVRNVCSPTTDLFTEASSSGSNRIIFTNFRVYWTDDLQDELLDGPVRITDYSGNNSTVRIFTADNGKFGTNASINGSKANPCLSADLFGDWREEIICLGASTTDTYDLNIFSTSIPTPYLVTTPMQDHVYRMGIAWQNVAYNQPPHLGYYLPDVASVKVTFDSQGYTSFSSNKNVTMAGMDGVTAYKGTLDGSTIKLYKVTEIPAGQGAILHGEGMANKTVYLPVIYDADEIANNAFVGAPDGATVAEKSAYVLSYTSSKGEAFYVYGGTSIPAGKAYLPIPAGGAKVLYFAFEDETGVMEIPVANGSRNDGFYYSITGVRVENPTKGIYIKNGKKVYIK